MGNNCRFKMQTNYDQVIEKLELNLMFDSAKNGIYAPLSIRKVGHTLNNIWGYMSAKNPKMTFKEAKPEFFVEFAKDTEKKLGVHPLYTLWLLKQDLQFSHDMWIDYKNKNHSEMGELGIKMMDDLIEGTEYAIGKIPKAMEIFSKKPIRYVV